LRTCDEEVLTTKNTKPTKFRTDGEAVPEIEGGALSGRGGFGADPLVVLVSWWFKPLVGSPRIPANEVRRAHRVRLPVDGRSDVGGEIVHDLAIGPSRQTVGALDVEEPLALAAGALDAGRFALVIGVARRGGRGRRLIDHDTRGFLVVSFRSRDDPGAQVPHLLGDGLLQHAR
jgi:hypothetical protein